MNDLASLKEILSGLAVPAPRFSLDSRSTEQLLQSLYDYAALIPFDTGHSWADVYFNGEATPASLARLFDDPTLADGTLLPHQAFMLGFLNLLQTPRALLNYFPAAHRELYYRGLLGVSERSAAPDDVVLSFALKSGAVEQMIPRGTLFDGGQDTQGVAVRYALNDSLLVNRGSWSDLRWCQPEPLGTTSTIQDTCILFDASKGIAWPQDGVRLFAKSTSSQRAPTGRIVGSELLAMSGGTRTIKVTFKEAISDPGYFTFYVSSEDHWINVQNFSTDPDDPLTLILVVPGTAAPISRPDNLDDLKSLTPLLKLVPILDDVVPEVSRLEVSASGINEVQYSTDDGVERLNGLSYPFGQRPVLGSGFNLVATEWCGHTVPVTLTLTPQWIDLPDISFPAWYKNYPDGPADNSSFKVQPLLMSSAGSSKLAGTTSADAQPSSTDALALFASGAQDTDIPQGNTLTITLPARMNASAQDSPDPRDWAQWLRLELSGNDFLHQEYEQLAGTAGVNPPYTPQIKSMTMCHTATANDITQSVLTPFGRVRLDDSAQMSRDKLHLYLGFTDSRPGDTLSLYWRIQSPGALTISWQYLSASNKWLALDDTVIDGTHGLLGSGLWSAILPDDASADAEQMPAGRYWLRALIPPVSLTDSSVYAYPALWDIEPNSMTATLTDADALAIGHFTRPLPAGTIRNSVTPLTGIGQVVQPWPSYGGVPPELPRVFFERIASRLNHRNRALTWFDIQALLKARYPEVFGIGIPSADTTCRLPAPTKQIAIVVPVSGKKDNSDAQRPALSQAHLQEMADYLATLASPWADFVLNNPTYRTVALDYDVTYDTGVNPSFAQRQLTDALEARYMSWSWDQQVGVPLGNRLDYYAIIAFIQRQPYVKQVNSLTLDGGKQSVQAADGEVLILGTGAGTFLAPIDGSRR